MHCQVASMHGHELGVWRTFPSFVGSKVLGGAADTARASNKVAQSSCGGMRLQPLICIRAMASQQARESGLKRLEQSRISHYQ